MLAPLRLVVVFLRIHPSVLPLGGIANFEPTYTVTVIFFQALFLRHLFFGVFFCGNLFEANFLYGFRSTL